MHLRALTLERVLANTYAHRFKAAYHEAATMRVDLNVLVDALGADFLELAPEFVQQVADPGAICDLLSALRPGNCLASGGRYAYAAQTDVAHQQEDASRMAASAREVATANAGSAQAANADSMSAAFADKVNRCCEALRAACSALSGRHLQAVVMSHLRCVVTCCLSVHCSITSACAQRLLRFSAPAHGPH